MPGAHGAHTRRGVCHANPARSAPRTRCPDPHRCRLARRGHRAVRPDSIAAAQSALWLVAGVLAARGTCGGSGDPAAAPRGSTTRADTLAFHPAQEFLHDAAIEFVAQLPILDPGIDRGIVV